MIRLCLLMLTLPLALSARTWHFTDGKTVEGELLSYKNGTVILKKDAGGKGLYTIGTFSEEDQAVIREAFPGGDAKPRKPAASQTHQKNSAPPRQPANRQSPREESNRPTTSKQPPHPGLKKLNVGMTPPPITWRIPATMEHQQVDLSKHRGKVLVVQFWAGSAPASLNEMRSLASIYPTLQRYGIDVVGVNIDTNRRTMQSYENQVKKPWRNYFDPKRKTVEQWGVQALPTNVILDQNGTIIAEHMPVNQLGPFLNKYVDPKRMAP